MIGPLPYIGGKNRLASRIISLIPEHTTYVEPFCGGAQVFFHKQPSEVEVLNDLSYDIVNFLRVCQWHHEELVRHMRYTVASRRMYDQYASSTPENLTDVQRAARFLYLQKNSFGGRVTRQHYHYGVVQKPNFNPEKIPTIIEETAKRLTRVQIESLRYGQVLTKYDRPTTFFYLDPPYWGPQLYLYNFSAADFAALAQRLSGIQGKFLLSLNDRPEVRETFAPFHIMDAEISYSAQPSAGRTYREVFITNFDLMARGHKERTPD